MGTAGIWTLIGETHNTRQTVCRNSVLCLLFAVFAFWQLSVWFVHSLQVRAIANGVKRLRNLIFCAFRQHQRCSILRKSCVFHLNTLIVVTLSCWNVNASHRKAPSCLLKLTLTLGKIPRIHDSRHFISFNRPTEGCVSVSLSSVVLEHRLSFFQSDFICAVLLLKAFSVLWLETTLSTTPPVPHVQ